MANSINLVNGRFVICGETDAGVLFPLAGMSENKGQAIQNRDKKTFLHPEDSESLESHTQDG